MNADDKIVIPRAATELKARICAVAHQGRHGHLPHEVSTRVIQKYFTWPGLKAEVRRWMANCLQCIKLKGGKLMPRPMGHMLQAQQPMEVIDMDFLAMPFTGRKSGYKYILVIVDQLTRVCICVSTKDCPGGKGCSAPLGDMCTPYSENPVPRRAVTTGLVLLW